MNRFTALLPAMALAFAQNPAPPVPATAIRMDVNLVQVDAVITDSRGHHVGDLKAGEFELLQDGKPQTITNFSYVAAPAPVPASVAAAAKPAKGEVPPPPAVLHPSEVRRTLALIVDDLGLAGENIAPVRETIRKFIDEQMAPDDLVALVRTSAGMGALQQFTTDKRMLHAALDRLKYGQSRMGVSSFTPLGSGPRSAAEADMNHLREDSLADSSMGAIRYVVNGMTGLPGRKSVVLFTENIRLIYRDPHSRTTQTDQTVSRAVQQLTDAATRANVVIHAIDPRGLPDPSVTASDDTARMSSRRVSRVPAQRTTEVMRTRDGMFELAEQTGGLFLHDSNDLSGALRTAAEDGDGYYLLGYHPDATTFEGDDGQAKFHRIEVRVKKPGLHVRSRAGFFGTPGGGTPGGGNPSPGQTREFQLNRALQSPYAGTLHPRLTAFFSNVKPAGSFITALLHFDAKELKWSEEPDGSHKTSVDVAAVTVDQYGVPLATLNTTFPLQLNSQQYRDALHDGMLSVLRFSTEKPGPYLVRAALRNPATEAAGSAEQFLEVPDVAAGHLALSGILLQDSSAQPSSAPQAPPPIVDWTVGGASRIFRSGAVLAYYYEILNAAAIGGHPDVDVQTRVFHNGSQILTRKTAIDTGANPQRLDASGGLQIGAGMPPGEYVLQVIVTDKLAKGKLNVVTQSVDFEVEKQ